PKSAATDPKSAEIGKEAKILPEKVKDEAVPEPGTKGTVLKGHLLWQDDKKPGELPSYDKWKSDKIHSAPPETGILAGDSRFGTQALDGKHQPFGPHEQQRPDPSDRNYTAADEGKRQPFGPHEQQRPDPSDRTYTAADAGKRQPFGPHEQQRPDPDDRFQSQPAAPQVERNHRQLEIAPTKDNDGGRTAPPPHAERGQREFPGQEAQSSAPVNTNPDTEKSNPAPIDPAAGKDMPPVRDAQPVVTERVPEKHPDTLEPPRGRNDGKEQPNDTLRPASEIGNAEGKNQGTIASDRQEIQPGKTQGKTETPELPWTGPAPLVTSSSGSGSNNHNDRGASSGDAAHDSSIISSNISTIDSRSNSTAGEHEQVRHGSTAGSVVPAANSDAAEVGNSVPKPQPPEDKVSAHSEQAARPAQASQEPPAAPPQITPDLSPIASRPVDLQPHKADEPQRHDEAQQDKILHFEPSAQEQLSHDLKILQAIERKQENAAEMPFEPKVHVDLIEQKSDKSLSENNFQVAADSKFKDPTEQISAALSEQSELAILEPMLDKTIKQSLHLVDNLVPAPQSEAAIIINGLLSGQGPGGSELIPGLSDEVNTPAAMSHLGAELAQSLGITGDTSNQIQSQLSNDPLEFVLNALKSEATQQNPLATIENDIISNINSATLSSQDEKEKSESKRLLDKELSEKERRENEDKLREEESKKYAAAMLAALKARQAQEEANRVKAQKDLLNLEARQKYIVMKGDTLESIAQKRLFNRRLAPLLYEINKARIPVRLHENRELLQLKARLIIFLPSQMEIRRYQTSSLSGNREKFEYDIEQESVAKPADNSIASRLLQAFETGSSETKARPANPDRRANVESLLGKIIEAADSSQQDDGRIKYSCRLGDSLRSVAMRHPALKDVGLWKLLAEQNNLSTQTDQAGNPLAELKRGSVLRLPFPHEIAEFRQKQQDNPSPRRASKTAENPVVKMPPPAATTELIGSTDEELQTIDSSDESQYTTHSRIFPGARDYLAQNPSSKIITSETPLQRGDSARNQIKSLSENCRIVSFGNMGSDGAGFRARLEYKQNEFWLPVVLYEINDDGSWKHEFKQNGSRSSRRFDLPTSKAKQMAENDLNKNWQEAVEKFKAIS
ncbi:MAG: hypothetical protein K2X27_15740, partial [Candidatus Obscuribacterales bacterium]|nr:hypothetical protein [Candidatus Obscuribacterales bacterium]